MQKATKETSRYAIGVDYGTNSVRALLVDLADGSKIATQVYDYPTGENGILLDPKNPLVARQNPRDYITGFFEVVRQVVSEAKKKGIDPSTIIGIGIDATSSTPLPVDAEGTPLAFHPEFEKDLAAQAWLWKDHSAHAEGARITELAKQHPQGFLGKCGGIYSSEWIWAKALHCKTENPKVFKAAATWVECADFVPGYITGNLNPATLVRGMCGAGHKALYHEKWGGLPDKDFFNSIDPALVPYCDLFSKAQTSDCSAGGLTAEAAKKTGLPEGTPVAAGSIDAHMGAVGAGVKPGTLVEVIGTSACVMTVHPLSDEVPDIPGLSGIIPGSIIPGMYGFEAGQTAVGDIFNWFVSNIVSAGPLGKTKEDPHVWLTEEASKLRPGESGLLALDWNNGNRSLLGDPLLTGLLIGQTLHTTAAEIYRALIEATAFGGLTIIRQIEKYGIPVKQVIFTGGIAEKNPVLMQIYADIYNRPMMISRSSQTCALGAAINGAVAGGGYKTIPQAQRKMTAVRETIYKPNKKAAALYARLYEQYCILHDSFGQGRPAESVANVMHCLTKIRNEARGSNC